MIDVVRRRLGWVGSRPLAESERRCESPRMNPTGSTSYLASYTYAIRAADRIWRSARS